MVPRKSWAGVALVVVVTFGLTALGAVLAPGTVLAMATAIVGWLIVAPVLAILTYYEDDDPAVDAEDDDPVATVRERYARGELTEEEFERRLDRLLETETSGAGEPAQGRQTERAEIRER